MPKKTAADLQRDIERYLAAGGEPAGLLFRGGGRPVVKPHTRTGRSCETCGRFHSLADHARHARGGAATAAKAAKVTKPRATRAKRAAATESPRVAPRVQQEDLLARVRRALPGVRGEGRFGDRKVFVSSLYDAVGPEMTLDAFKRWLVQRHKARDLTLARADLVAAMDPDLVARSEISHTPPATYHFVVDSPR